MLRASSQVAGKSVDLESVVAGSAVKSGVPADKVLLAYAEAALTDDADAISAARQRVADEVGETAMVDAAGVVANFQRMVRIADGTGIPLDGSMTMLTAGIREDLGINAYGSSVNTPEVSWPKKLLGRMVQPFLPRLLKRITRRMTAETADHAP